MNCALLYPALPSFSNNRPCISHNYDCHSPSILSQLFNFDIGGRPIFSKKVSFADTSIILRAKKTVNRILPKQFVQFLAQRAIPKPRNHLCV